MLASHRVGGVGWSPHTIGQEVDVSRFWRVLLVAVFALAVAASPAAAIPDKKLGVTLGGMWKRVLETPTPQNPFGGGGPLCVELGGVVAPFGAPGTESITCTVKPGTKVLVAAWSAECSTLEGPPFHGDDETSLRACARAVNGGIATTDVVVFLDGKRVPVTEVMSGLLRLDLPADNIFGMPAGTGSPPYLSVADGWVALLHPLTPGTHTIMLNIVAEFPPGTPLKVSNTTTIIVKPGS
jgi:hypothetical protein